MRVRQVVQNPSVFRRVPVQVIDCDPNLYLFLVRHPEVVVNIWQVMGISKVKLVRTGQIPTRGRRGGHDRQRPAVLQQSRHASAVCRRECTKGRCSHSQSRPSACWCLRAGYVQETNGHYYITNRLDTFIHIDHVGLDLIAKTFSPLVTKTVDINFRETAAFVGVVSRTAAGNPQGMQRLAGKLTALEPEVRGELVRLSYDVAQRAQAAANQSNTLLTGPRPMGKQLRR